MVLQVKCTYLLKNNSILDQIIKQLEKLYDVLEVSVHQDYDQSVFENLNKVLKLKQEDI